MIENRPAFLTRAQLALTAIWVAIVVPAIPLGYGSDDDAWLVYRAARNIWRTGLYERSRSTGFPMHELLVTPFVHFGSWWLANAVSLVMGLVFLAALYRLWNRGHFRNPLLVVLSTAFLPVFVKSASTTMDYVSAAAVLAWAYVFMIEGREFAGAGLVGLAAGFRPSSGLFIGPLAVMVRSRGATWLKIALLAAVATAVGALAFSPALLRYGIGNSVDADRLGTSMTLVRRIVLAGYYGTQFYGVLGTLLMGAVLALGLLRRGRALFREDGPVLWFHATNVIAFGGLFALLPVEPEYLFPVILSVAVLMDRLLSRSMFIGVAIVLLSYHVIQLDLRGGSSGARTFHPAMSSGFTVRDMQDRIFKLSVRERSLACSVSVPTVLMHGQWWIPDLEGSWVYLEDLRLWKRRGSEFYVAQPIREVERLRELKARGMRIVIWEGAMSEYFAGRGEERRPYVEVIAHLEDLVGGPLKGRAASD
jgi:hypothetical protein